VDYLGQDLIMEDREVNTRNSDGFFTSNTLPTGSAAPAKVVVFRKKPRRFATRINTNMQLELWFGSGISDVNTELVTLNSSQIANSKYNQSISNSPLYPSDFISSDTFGLAPANTTLTVTYLVGGGIASNVPSNTITEIISVGTLNPTLPASTPTLNNAVVNSLAINNPTAALGGRSQETIEEIRQNALAQLATQNRAVTREDYTNLVLQNFPQIKTVNVYGGEDVDPPQFGKVIITAIPYGSATILSTELKNSVISFLTPKNITTEPIIADAEYLFVEITSDVKYDPSLTSKSTQLLKTEVLNQIIQYDSLHLNNFGDDLRKSKLLSMIDSADDSIVSNQTNLRAIYKITPTRTITNRYNFTYGNAIYRPVKIAYNDSETEAVLSSTFSYNKDGVIYDARISDDGLGNLRIYFLTSNSIKVILENNIGTVDYLTGNMLFNINPFDYINSIDIYAKLQNDDIIVQQNKFLKIDYDKLSISINVFNQ